MQTREGERKITENEVKNIVVEAIQDYKRDLEKLRDNKLDKTINECDKTIELFLKNIDNYSINEEYLNFLKLSCKLEKIKDEVRKLDNVVGRLIKSLKLFIKMYD